MNMLFSSVFVKGNTGDNGFQGFPGLAGLKGEKGLSIPGACGPTGPKGIASLYPNFGFGYMELLFLVLN